MLVDSRGFTLRNSARALMRVLLFFTPVFLIPVFALGEPISPDLVRINTPVYRPSLDEFKPPLGTYTYNVSWQGIPAATLTAKVEQNAMSYHIEALAKTYSAIDIFYKLRYRAEGIISAIDFYPQHTYIEQRENSRNRTTEIVFDPSGTIETTRKDLVKDETKNFKFDPGNFTLDPFSAAFIARGLKWEKGDTKEFDTYNGKSRYHIKLFAEDKVQMKINGEMKDVWVISPSVYNLTNSEQNQKLRKAEIYVTADKSRDIVKIVSSVFVGSVTTKLVGFEPSNEPVTGTHVAAKDSHVILE